MFDFNLQDIIKYKGKSINSVTKNKEYTITEKFYSNENKCFIVRYLDNNKKEKQILLNNNQWRKKFEYVSNARKEKLKKLNEIYETSK